jgi:hypothetical protein
VKSLPVLHTPCLASVKGLLCAKEGQSSGTNELSENRELRKRRLNRESRCRIITIQRNSLPGKVKAFLSPPWLSGNLPPLQRISSLI